MTARELKIIELRTHGVKTPQIAKVLGIPTNTAYEALWRIYRKVGVDDVALLTRWAIKWGLDGEARGCRDPQAESLCQEDARGTHPACQESF
jgi:DNA-binding CsgD family transcriptional regulator